MVVGSSGGGKSTLSRKLAQRFGLEYQSIDRDVRWLPGWGQRNREEQLAILRDLVQRERWIMDGSNPSTFDLRLPRTDVVIWVRMPRWLCLLGVARRVARYHGTVRPEMAPGCPEPLPDREFLSYIWNFEKRHAPVFIRNLDLYGHDVPIIQLKSRSDTRLLLDLLGLQD
jgi:adenylate kinase family enzyme